MENLNGNDSGENPEAKKWEDMVAEEPKGEKGSDQAHVDVYGTGGRMSQAVYERAVEESQENSTNETESREESKETKDREKSRAEKRIDAYQKRLEEIDAELRNMPEQRDKLEEELDYIEEAINDNSREHGELSTKADELEIQIKKCRRGFFSQIGAMFREATNLRFNKGRKSNHEKRRKALESALENDRIEEESEKNLEDTREQLAKNESEAEELANERGDTLDKISKIDSKATRLSQEKAKLESEIEELREIVANEAWEEAIADRKGGHSTRRLQRDIEGYRENANRYFDEQVELVSPDVERHAAREQWGSQEHLSERLLAEEMERKVAEQSISNIEKAREEANANMDLKINTIKGIAETESIRGSLMRLKRKIMLRLRGL